MMANNYVERTVGWLFGAKSTLGAGQSQVGLHDVQSENWVRAEAQRRRGIVPSRWLKTITPFCFLSIKFNFLPKCLFSAPLRLGANHFFLTSPPRENECELALRFMKWSS
jgi:hypothetical protein